tara:strand:+ start:68 stop:598 length:531 start_codon:yes stop_codon:yes gene_type:complete
MSNEEVGQDEKTEAIGQDVKTEVVESNDKAEDYSVPGYRFKELNEKNKALESKVKAMETDAKAKVESEAVEREEFKELYEATKVERDKFASDAEKYYSIEEARKSRLLESFPENLREKMSKLDSETLEQMKTEFTNKVPQVDNSGGGVSGGKSLEWSKLAPNERKKHFADIMRGKS